MTTPFKTELRKWRGKLYQKEAAALLKINLRTYQAWEYGWNEPSEISKCEIRRRMETKPKK